MSHAVEKLSGSHGPPVGSWRRRFVWIGLPVAVGVAVYGHCARNGFVYDDHFFIVHNAAVRDLRHAPSVFSSAYFALTGERSIRPLVTLSIMMEWALWGKTASAFHLTNALLHLLNALLVTRLVRRLFRRDVLASATGLLFLVHPVNAEVVNAVSFRDDSLCLLFSLLAILAFSRLPRIERPGRLLTLAPAGLFAVALAAKEVALVFALGCLVWTPVSTRRRQAARRWPAARAISSARWSCLAVVLAYGVLRFGVLRSPKEAWAVSDLVDFTRVTGAAGGTLLRYARLAVWPFHLRPIYSFDGTVSSAWGSAASLIVVVASLCLFVLAARFARRPIGFAVLWGGLSLLPVLNVVPILNPLAERHAYVPSIGVALLGAEVLLRCRQRKAWTRALAASVCVLLGAGSMARTFAWRDDEALWGDAARQAPAVSRTWNNLGCFYLDHRSPRTAARLFRCVRRLVPDDRLGAYNMASALRAHGDLAGALAMYRKCVEGGATPLPADWIVDLGSCLQQMGDHEKARPWYLKAIEIDPRCGMAYNNLSDLAMRKGRIDEAVDLLREAVRCAPTDPMFRLHLGNALRMTGHVRDGLEQYMQAAQAAPEFFQACFNAGEAYEVLGEDSEAAAMFRRVLSIDPANWRAHYKLSEIHARHGDQRRSRQHMRAACRCNRRLDEDVRRLAAQTGQTEARP